MPLLLILTVYLLPGFSLSRILRGKVRDNPLFWLFLSFIVTPFVYSLLAHLRLISLYSFLIVNIIIAILFSLIGRFGLEINFDIILAKTNLNRWAILFLPIFYLMTTLPRLGLLQGYYPIGDDMHRIGKTLSIAESSGYPLFYHFPTTRLTIYYFVTVGSGLLVKFSQNQITANSAWFIHTALWNLAILYFLGLATENLFHFLRAKLIFLLSITFFAGYEFYIALVKGINLNPWPHWTDLEWWTDWFTSVFNIHFQISSPYTLFFWVPQHLFAGILSLFLFLIWKTEIRRRAIGQMFLGLILSTIFGYSAFVFLTVVASLFLFQIHELYKGSRHPKEFIRENFVISIVFLSLSFDLVWLFLTAEKGSWFSLRLNSFWFLENEGLISKLLNLVMTIPLLLLVELGGLFTILIYSIIRVLKKEMDESFYFWHLNILLPLIIMFFVRAADDNNIALRSTIPSLIGLAFFAGNLFETVKRKKMQLIVSLLLLLSLPTTFSIFYQRLLEQKTYGKQNLKTIYPLIDKTVPLNSILLTDEKDQHTNLTVLAHRLAFKPLKEFNVTDKEYSAYSKISRYEDGKLNSLDEIEDFLSRVKREAPYLKDYKFYFLTKTNQNLPLVIESEGYKLYLL